MRRVTYIGLLLLGAGILTAELTSRGYYSEISPIMYAPIPGEGLDISYPIDIASGGRFMFHIEVVVPRQSIEDRSVPERIECELEVQITRNDIKLPFPNTTEWALGSTAHALGIASYSSKVVTLPDKGSYQLRISSEAHKSCDVQKGAALSFSRAINEADRMIFGYIFKYVSKLCVFIGFALALMGAVVSGGPPSRSTKQAV